MDKAIAVYVARIGQKFQAKSYLQSAVVNIKDTTTMQDLETLADHFKTKYHFQCYQIAIHRDEGHIDEFGNTQINHHAHMEFVTLDENTGKNRFKEVSAFTLMNMQTETAQILRMQRGERKRDYYDENGNLIKGTGRKRIKPRAYAQLMEQEKAKRIELENNNATLQNSNNSLAKEVSTYQEQIQDLQASVKNIQIELNTLKQEKTDLEQANTTLQQAQTTLTQENQELQDHSIELETTLIDLVTIFAPQGKQDKKLTIKEAKPLLENVRKQMIAINQGLGDLKLFIQEDYKSLRALKDQGLSIADLKKYITQIEQEAKERYEKLQEQYKGYLSPEQITEQYKDYLSPQQVENKITATKSLYKDYLSPKQVQELKQKHAQELEMKEQSHAKALETKDTEHAKVLQEKQKEINSLKNENTQKDGSINSLKGQITQHTQELATLKTTNQQLQQENLKLKPVYLTKTQIRARRLAERQELMGKGCPKEAFRELSDLDDEKLTQAQLDERILNIWLKYAPSYIASLENTNANLEQETQTLKTELKIAKTEAKSQAHIKAFEKEAVHLIKKYVVPVTSGVVAHIQASGKRSQPSTSSAKRR
ncbi:hypothetical protein NHP190002_11240 [Helicobacter ailurogastricus]|nr:hypothetical protein NHP190002_11240 [Helicobacter ailurogastricus]